MASKCPDTCCSGWQIYIDENTGKEYLKDNGEVGKIARECLRGKPCSYHLALKNGRCPYLTEENLCKVIIEKGENLLSEVCANHPRFTHPLYEDEYSFLSLSCPKASQMFLSSAKNGGVEYVKEGLENPYLSCFFDTVCEILGQSNEILAQFYKQDSKQFSLVVANMFGGMECLESQTKDALSTFSVDAINEKYFSSTTLFNELFKYFALALYDEKSPVLCVATVFALAVLYLCSVWDSEERAIYKFVKETEHSAKNIKRAISLMRSPKARNTISPYLKEILGL
jgi:hypothetical protein